MRRVNTITVMSFAGLTFLQGCAQAEQEEEADILVGEQPIVGGAVLQSNPYFAAVYHKGNSSARGYHWLGRPCSGTILRRSQGTSWILTARHCVVPDGENDIYATPIAASDIRVTTQLNPGVLRCTARGCAAPSSSTTYAPIKIHVPPAPSTVTRTDSAYNMAILQVPNYLPLTGTGRIGIDFSPVSGLASIKIRHYGYGRGVYNSIDSDEPELTGVATGAGILRGAYDFPTSFYIPPDLHSYVTYGTAAQPAGASVSHGDSGGPGARLFTRGSFTPSGSTIYNWEQLIGVHHSSTMDCAAAAHANWLQSVMNYAYLSPISKSDMNLGLTVSAPASGAPLSLVTGDATNTRWNYNPETKELRIFRGYAGAYDNLCLTDIGSTAQLAECSPGNSTQQWTVATDQSIRGAAGTCLWYYNSAITLGACNGSYPTFWGWHFEA